MADDPKTSKPHPNASIDPDCTSQEALEEALQHRIAAELHYKTIAYLNAACWRYVSVTELQALIEEWRSEIETKYTSLRKLIGLTKGD